MSNKNKPSTIKKNKEIKNIYLKGKAIQTPEIIIKFFKTPNDYCRYAVSTNKKKFRTAILRNKIKRQIKSIMSLLTNLKNTDLLIIVNSNYLKKSFEQNKQNIIKIITSIK